MSRARPLAESMAEIERLAAALGHSRSATIALAGSPSAAARIARGFATGAVTVGECWAMLTEARLASPGVEARNEEKS